MRRPHGSVVEKNVQVMSQPPGQQEMRDRKQEEAAVKTKAPRPAPAGTIQDFLMQIGEGLVCGRCKNICKRGLCSRPKFNATTTFGMIIWTSKFFHKGSVCIIALKFLGV